MAVRVQVPLGVQNIANRFSKDKRLAIFVFPPFTTRYRGKIPF